MKTPVTRPLGEVRGDMRPDAGEESPPPRRKVWRVIRWALLAFVLWLVWSVGSALTAPGTDGVAARLAEWGRGHGLGGVVLALEKLQYSMSPAQTGGTPKPGLLAPSTPPATQRASAPVLLRPRLQTIAQPPLAGEGTWRSLYTSRGHALVQAAFLRPDRLHTSYLTGVVWMDSKRLRYELHPGFSEPGGSWAVPDWIPPGQRRGLAATWNGAFRLADARGGFYLQGRTARHLIAGAASEVFYRDGTMTVGTWGRDATMTPRVAGVRQNLGLLIDHGAVVPDVNHSPLFHWGLTLGGDYYVFRSGVGVTAQGDVVYASGDALSVQDLARILQRAGCVRAMELDINPAWVSFMSYQPGSHPDDPTPRSLLPDYRRPANRYYEHTSRDFVAAFTRG